MLKDIFVKLSALLISGANEGGSSFENIDLTSTGH